jgi:uncharacterized protein YgiM (DUF1202 family)
MQKMFILSAAAAAVLTAGSAYADTIATATRDLNVRAGPGTPNPIVGVIGSGQSVNVIRCLESGRWCTVAFGGGEGWVSSNYLTSETGSDTVVLSQRSADSGVRVVRRADNGGGGTVALVGAAGGVVAGAIAGGPVGAAIGGAAGLVAGGTTGQVIDPPRRVRTYVTSHRIEPVELQGEVVVGTDVPDTVELQRIPDYRYRYAYLNDEPVLVEPGSRRIVYVME